MKFVAKISHPFHVNSPLSISLFIWETRLGKDRIPDRGTGPYPHHYHKYVYILWCPWHSLAFSPINMHASGPVHYQHPSVTFIQA